MTLMWWIFENAPSCYTSIRLKEFTMYSLFIFYLYICYGTASSDSQRSCNRTREILTSSFGVITDGPERYQPESHCEWLIKGPTPYYYVTLNISNMDTECSYDHLYIYNGETYSSPLLAVFSGKSSPSPVTTTQGTMLILLYTDTNYEREGFEASYSITECPLNCSSQGQCINHTCVCSKQYTGSGCEIEFCPEDCGVSMQQGTCFKPQTTEDSSPHPACFCSKGYSGDSCSLGSDSTGDSWKWIHRAGQVFTPRTSHGTAYIESLDKMYIFGGYNLNDALDDLVVYNFYENSWSQIRNGDFSQISRKKRIHYPVESLLHPFQNFESSMMSDHGRNSKFRENIKLRDINFSVNNNNTVSMKLKNDSLRNRRMIRPSDDVNIASGSSIYSWPKARFGHCMTSYEDHFVFYGGKLQSGEVSSEFWLFNTTTEKWKLVIDGDDYFTLKVNSERRANGHPPPLAYCSLTLVDGVWLYLFGGSLTNGEFSNRMFKINMQHSLIWEKVEVYGGNNLKARLVGHSAVFYEKTRALYIYGGIRADIPRFSKLSDQLLAFNIDKQFWSEINYPPKGPMEEPPPLERAFHTSIIAGDYMVVFGGYMHRHKEEEACYDHRIYLFHLGCHLWLSPKLIGSLTNGSYPRNQGLYSHGAFLRNGNTLIIVGGFHGQVTNHVIAYMLPSTIVTATGAIFNADEACRRHKSQSLCISNVECAWCATDNSCYDKRRSANCTTNLQTKACPGLCPTLRTCQSCLLQGESNGCSWCVKTQSCLSRDSVNYGSGNCGTPQHQQGWWGNDNLLLTNINECRQRDIAPGFILLNYRDPANFSQPDYVEIIKDLKDIKKRGPHKDLHTIKYNKYRWVGFLHPKYMRYTSFNNVYNREPVQLALYAYKVNVTLLVSTDDSQNHLEQKAELYTKDHPRSAEITIDNKNPRLLLRLDISKQVEGGLNNSLNVSLKWSSGNNYKNHLSIQHMEPFGQGAESCLRHTNCLSCLSDSYCGWCPALKTCIPRDSSLKLGSCAPHHYLVLNALQCEQCEDFIYCRDCVQTRFCEWQPEKAHCTRRGRDLNSTRTLEQCPVECHARRTCVSCLGEAGLCAWCEITKECFLFSVYTSAYQYGACRIWIDEDHTNVTSIYNGISNSNLLSPYNSSIYSHHGECRICEDFRTCDKCLQNLGCGWCYNKFNPTVGICTSGDFSKPSKGECDFLIEPVMIEARKNSSIKLDSLETDSIWTYSACPDVDECLLELHDCHLNATCNNTVGDYDCICPRGFKGNGRDTCEKTCYENCVHGRCSEGPSYRCMCHLGWTGIDCSINCGCYNHSTCKSVGICDKCQDETTGEFCHLCRPGSYGNATTVGCKKCDCNGHWDEERGLCNQSTGECFCKDNTFGHTCNRCKPGFYGEPRNGGRCYQQCTAKGIITNATRGYFGSEIKTKEGLSNTCLWILSAHGNIDPPLNRLEGQLIVQVTIEGMEIDCNKGPLYIYEGLPDFVSVKSVSNKRNLLGTFCKGHSSYPTSVQATSGIMTVYYKQHITQGFEASYQVLRCPDNPGQNRRCKHEKPVCEEGWKGVLCDVPICPNKCHESEQRGRCDNVYGRCICYKDYVGEDCGYKFQPHMVVLQELFNPLKIGASLSYLRRVLPRFGHTLVVDHQGSLWVFGGYSLSRGPLNDIQQFDTRNRSWVSFTLKLGEQPPSERYFHASAYVFSRNEMYVYGGMNKTHFLNDFWKFDMYAESWKRLSIIKGLPALGGHTLTCRSNPEPESLILIGGVSAEHGLLEDPWEFDLNRYTWERMKTSGSKPVGIFGHSTVFHSSTRTFYVFGGYTYQDGIALSDDLYALDYVTKRWSILPPDSRINLNPKSRPAPRAFHTSVSTIEYMVSIGGYISDRLDSNQDIIVYSYKCNMWIPLNNHFITVTGYDLNFPLIGLSGAIDGSSIYLIGGFSGTVPGSVIQLSIPEDLCTLNANKTQCQDRIGCANCVIYDNNGTNTSYCYSNTKPDPEVCLNPPGKLTSVKGVTCDVNLLEGRSCYYYKTCAECLSEWSIYEKTKQVCKWCASCQRGFCVQMDDKCPKKLMTCKDSIKTHTDNKEVNNLDECPELSCDASDCEKCLSSENCNWARRDLEDGEKNDAHDKTPISQWGCTHQKAQNYSSEIFSPVLCPRQCHSYHNCNNCLQMQYDENQYAHCYWSPILRKCLSHNLLPLQCLGGTCGNLLNAKSQCIPPCASFTNCNDCLLQGQCGWCSINTHIGGLGVCTEGRMEGPWRGRCQDLNYGVLLKNRTSLNTHKIRHDSIKDDITNGSRDVTWHYGVCPPENECKNGHHTCDAVKEICVDELEGYVCECAAGYNMSDKNKCHPVCSKGCVHGDCIKPEDCSCHFGYVGVNCGTKCECYGHSNCAGPDELDICLECHNNTIGSQCQKCRENYVGDPTKNEKCKSCNEYCHGHTSICTSKKSLNFTNENTSKDSDESYYRRFDNLSLGETVCQECANNTTGIMCHKCKPGFFRGSTKKFFPCRPCECNGHGSTCDADWGIKCNCQNNTESPCKVDGRIPSRIPVKEEDKDCWKRQCSKCKEPYIGNPVDGHQCFRVMKLGRQYCFDQLKPECHDPSPLVRGKVVLFAVQPNFSNVDIRLFIDIAEGSVDVYFATYAEGFVVRVNKSTWHHEVDLDESFKPVVNNNEKSTSFFKSNLLFLITKLATPKVYLEKNKSTDGDHVIYSRSTDGLKTYFTLRDSRHFLVLNNLTDRLVVTLPKENHNLEETKFYIVLHGVSNHTYGAIYFRQDTPKIDLFVFFSVFFSCFFLFLAVCVVVWKVKLRVDQQRARRRHVVEMLHMAKRPFASLTLHLHPEASTFYHLLDSHDHILWSPTWLKRATLKKDRTGVDKFDVGLIAVEPTEDEIAAVGTLVVQLPGGGIGEDRGKDDPPQRLALGSSLCLLSSVIPPPNTRQFHLRRRQSSHAAAC